MNRASILGLIALGGCSWPIDLGSPAPTCEPETDAQYCAQRNKDCDLLQGSDRCGQPRTVDCGRCTPPQECGVRGKANVCGWVGVAWLSGAGTEDVEGFGHWRARPLDVQSLWTGTEDWDAIESIYVLDRVNNPDGTKKFSGRLSITQPLMPSTEGDLRTCAAGGYVSHFRAAAQKLSDFQWDDAYVRLGWQDNEACRWCASPDQESDWKACFRSAATAFREVSPRFVRLWNMNRRFPGDVSRLWPGDEFVDAVAIDFYDMPPHFTSQELWDADFDSVEGNGPRGLGTWIAFARAHGKKLAVPEWGISGSDNPFFIEKMYEFFWRHAGDIEFEALFNLRGINYQLYPIDENGNPNAGARYRELF